MKRKNLIATKKVEARKLLIKDQKIKKFYSKFKSIILTNIKRKNFALAVSGGPDSLCLAYLSKIYASEYNNKIDILVVNHKLRKESHVESFKSQKNLKKEKNEMQNSSLDRQSSY